MRYTNQAGIDLIKSFEGFKATAYLDIVGVPTIGYGTTEGVTKDDVKNGRTITQAHGEELLKAHLAKVESGINQLVKIQINDNQFSALACFAYNLGLGALEKSTLLSLLNAGDVTGAADQFLRWDHAGGKQVPGLTRRRQAERSLFLQTVSLLPDEPSDQEIQDKLKDIEKDV